MKSLTFLILGLFILLSVGMLACDSKVNEPAKVEESAKTDESQADEPTKEHARSEKAHDKLAMVKVTREGSRFDPPVKPEQIPTGVWYCDMGTVEYATLVKGEGDCPVCGMMLKQKKTVGQRQVDSHGHDGHDH